MVIGLWRHQEWAYPFPPAFLVAFVVYELDRITFAPSVGLALWIVLDVFVIWFVWRD